MPDSQNNDFLRRFQQRMVQMVVAIVIVVGVGAAGYMTFAGYMALTTVTTIGVTTLFVAIGVLTQAMIELELSGYFPKRGRRRMIDNLKSHFFIYGHGLIAADAGKTYLILSAKALNPLLPVATRVSEDESERKLRRAGADIVFAPYTITCQRLSHSLLKPHVNEFIDFTPGSGMGLDIHIEQVQVAAQSEYVSKSLRQAQLRAGLGIIVPAIRKVSGQMIFNPPADAEIDAGDRRIVMGQPVQLRRPEELMEEKVA